MTNELRNAKKRIKNVGQHLVIPVGTINGDAFWECGKTTLILPRQKTQSAQFDDARQLTAIKNHIYMYEVRGWKTVVAYQRGVVYPVFKTRAAALYHRDFATPHSHAIILSMRELQSMGGWELNVEQVAYRAKPTE